MKRDIGRTSSCQFEGNLANLGQPGKSGSLPGAADGHSDAGYCYGEYVSSSGNRPRKEDLVIKITEKLNIR